MCKSTSAASLRVAKCEFIDESAKRHIKMKLNSFVAPETKLFFLFLRFLSNISSFKRSIGWKCPVFKGTINQAVTDLEERRRPVWHKTNRLQWESYVLFAVVFDKYHNRWFFNWGGLLPIQGPDSLRRALKPYFGLILEFWIIFLIFLNE